MRQIILRCLKKDRKDDKVASKRLRHYKSATNLGLVYLNIPTELSSGADQCCRFVGSSYFIMKIENSRFFNYDLFLV